MTRTFFGLPCRVDEDLAEGWFRVRYPTGHTELRRWGEQPIPPGASSLEIAREEMATLVAKFTDEQLEEVA